MPNRYEDEIENILQQAGVKAPRKGGKVRNRRFLSLVWLYFLQAFGGRTWSITPSRIMLAAAALLLSALVMTAAIPGLAGPLAWAGLILFIIGYAMFFIRPRRVEKRWRGEPIDDKDKRWIDRFRRR